MNKIVILAPRWKDRKVLIADYKIGQNNEIRITAAKKDGTPYYPNPFYATGEMLRKYPLVEHPHGKMREVPLSDLLEWL